MLAPVRRTQIYLDDDLDKQLRATAAAEGRSAAAVIREAVRRYLLDRPGGPQDPIQAAIGSVTGLPADAAEHHDRDLYATIPGGAPRR
jgi:plasmid stability protein